MLNYCSCELAVATRRLSFSFDTCAPSWIPHAIASFDSAVERTLSTIWNAGFSTSQRQLISLPTHAGGFGIPLACLSAWSAFAASASQSAPLQQLLIRQPGAANVNNPVLSDAITAWNLSVSANFRTTPEALLVSRNPQKFLAIRCTKDLQERLMEQTDDRGRARLRSLFTRHLEAGLPPSPSHITA